MDKEYSEEIYETTKVVCVEQSDKKLSCTLTGQKEIKELNPETNVYNYYTPKEPEEWDINDVEGIDFSGIKSYVTVDTDPIYITIENVSGQILGTCTPKEIHNKKIIECL